MKNKHSAHYKHWHSLLPFADAFNSLSMDHKQSLVHSYYNITKTLLEHKIRGVPVSLHGPDFSAMVKRSFLTSKKHFCEIW